MNQRAAGRNRFRCGGFAVLLAWASPLLACPPEGSSTGSLLELRAAGFVLEDDARRNILARDLLACVASPDPLLRDQVAFEGISTWLRGGQLSAETYQVLYSGLMLQLQAAPDRGGFRQPFAALLLSEVARVDRLQPTLDADQRNLLVETAADYLSGVRDYRGYSATEGWRHGVAHGSDLALQLVLNPAVSADQVKRLLEAVATQVAPEGEHFYIYGEPQRLARPVYYAYTRNLLDAEFWSGWFAEVAGPGSLPDWSDAFSSQAGLARRHNTMGFLLAMHLNATAGDDPALSGLEGLVVEALQRLP